ncbi:MAG: CGNR zinc finger domain-containing protein [Clostridia bacterium]
MPSALEVVREFVNTRDLEAGTEVLQDLSQLEGWLLQQGLQGEERSGPEDLEAARAIREGLREVLARHNGEVAVSSRLQSLAAALQFYPVAVSVRPDGALNWEPARPSPLGALVAVLSQAMADPDWPRLKVCRNDSCRWAFFDASRNRSHKWCSMGACGNLMKARAYRSRKRSRDA